jgi:phosphate-selective porin OprO/OprP
MQPTIVPLVSPSGHAALHRACAAALFVAVVLCGSPATAAPSDAAVLSELRAEVEALRARLVALESSLAAIGGATGESARPDEAIAEAAVEPPAATAPAVELRAGPGLRATDSASGGAFRIGGRIHYDAYAFGGDAGGATGGSEFRRARVQAEGSAAGWDYKVQLEMSGREIDLRDVYLKTKVADGTLTLGQFKPHRSLEELISSNDISIMERGFTTGSGLFTGRQWQQGIGFLRGGESGSLGISASTLRKDTTPRNEGFGVAARGTWAPILEQDRLLHLGLWGSVERGGQGTPPLTVDAAWAGRRGPIAPIFRGPVGRDAGLDAIGLELAGVQGPFHWQAEWARGRFDALPRDATVEAGYLQLGWLVGASRGYAVGEGLFKRPKPAAGGGWEFIARADRVRRTDQDGIGATRFVLGLNWYATDQVRLMLNWTRGSDEAADADGHQWGLRAQYVF